jgi:hypothetical protein
MTEKTMEVRLTVCRANPDSAHVAGDTITVATSEGRALIEAGQAEPVARTRAASAEKRPSGAKRAEKRS